MPGSPAALVLVRSALAGFRAAAEMGGALKACRSASHCHRAFDRNDPCSAPALKAAAGPISARDAERYDAVDQIPARVVILGDDALILTADNGKTLRILPAAEVVQLA